ncbi:hypothetical protein Tco_0694751 [Tanacetum coccineum]
MITEEMKHTEHYRMKSTRLTTPAPVPTIDKVDEMILQDTLQVSLAEHKSREEQESRENMELVHKHLASEEIEKMMEGSENVINDSLPPRNDEPHILDTRLKHMSDKESLEVEITNDEEVEITNVVILVNVNEEEEEITDEVYELKQREKGKVVEESRSTPFPIPIRSPRNHTNIISSNVEKLQELTVIDTQTTSSSNTHIKEQVKKQVLEQVRDQVPVSYMSGHILYVHLAQSQTLSVLEQQYQLYLFMKNDPQLQQQDIAIWLALQMKFENLQVPQTTCRPSDVRPRDQDDPHDDARPERENSAKRQDTSEYEAYKSGESSSGQVNEEERGPSTSDIMEEVSLTIDGAKLKKMADEMMRQRCTSGDEHQYHIDQMKNFLKSDIVWESRKEILASPHPRKTTPLVQSCQGDPKAPELSLINQDLLYLKKGSSGPEKIVLSLHKFPVIIFNDDDIEERTSRWVNKCVKKFNPYA